MNYKSPQLIDELAAQYAIGTLRGPARQRFERLTRTEPAALTALHRWEDKLVGLMAEVKPVEPPHGVWVKVQQRLKQGPRKEVNRGWFAGGLAGLWNRSQLTVAAGVAAIALSVGVVTFMSVIQTSSIATFANQWNVETNKGQSKLVVTRSVNVSLDPNRDYELWALPDSGAAPVSLGLMPKSGTRELDLNPAQRAALSGSGKIAVSLEPIGGSPTGAPTGPVLFVAEVTRA
jgi:anti-sigma-K factor RskA